MVLRNFKPIDYNQGACPYGENAVAKLTVLYNRGSHQHRYDPELDRATRFQLMREHGFYQIEGRAIIPTCASCHKCVPLRINGEKAIPSTSRQNRHLKQMQRFSYDLIESGRETHEHFALFSSYMRQRHAGSEMNDISREDFMRKSKVRTHALEVRDMENDNALVAYAWVDMHGNEASFDYLCYDVDISKKEGLGTFSWYALIDVCQRHDIEYMYDGIWVEGSPQMDYKKKFPGQETLVDGQWVDFNPDIHTERCDAEDILDRLLENGLE